MKYNGRVSVARETMFVTRRQVSVIDGQRERGGTLMVSMASYSSSCPYLSTIAAPCLSRPSIPSKTMLLISHDSSPHLERANRFLLHRTPPMPCAEMLWEFTSAWSCQQDMPMTTVVDRVQDIRCRKCKSPGHRCRSCTCSSRCHSRP